MKKLLLAMTCYGSHVETFFHYCLPSLNAEGNLPALRKHFDVGFIVHTTSDNAALFNDIGAAVYCDVTDGDKYDMVGRHQRHDLALAKSMGADYHLLMPDFIYSENCFAGVIKALELGHKSIARLVVSTVQEDIINELDRPRSAVDLATLGLKHIHPGIKNWFMTKGSLYPNIHALAWVGENTLHMSSPHCTLVYAASEAIRQNPIARPVDSILDMVIKGDIYFPKPKDGIVIIEVSPRASRKPAEKRGDLAEFVRIFKWDTRNSLRQLDIFCQETVDAIDRSALSGEYWNEVEICEQKSIVVNELKKNMGM